MQRLTRRRPMNCWRGAYQQGLTANGLMMGAEFDVELQQLDITLRDDQFTLEQMEAKEFQDALAMLCARTYGEDV